jgi:alpha-galactosidase
MGRIPWSLNRKWAGLLAKSGTPMFVSAKPGVLTDAENAELSGLYRVNSVQKDTCEPQDWMDTVCPAEWKINGEKLHIDWFTENGVRVI